MMSDQAAEAVCRFSGVYVEHLAPTWPPEHRETCTRRHYLPFRLIFVVGGFNNTFPVIILLGIGQ